MDEKELRVIVDKFPHPFAKIHYKGDHGIAFIIGENISEKWQSGDLIVFWEDGEYTVIPEEFDFLGLVDF